MVGLEVALGLVGGDAARGDDARQDFAEVGPLGDRLRGRAASSASSRSTQARPVTELLDVEEDLAGVGHVPRELGVSSRKLKRRLGFAA